MMKTLKMKIAFFSLLAITAVSVFLTSCEQVTTITGEELGVEALETTPFETGTVYTVSLPEGINAENIEEWLATLDEQYWVENNIEAPTQIEERGGGDCVWRTYANSQDCGCYPKMRKTKKQYRHCNYSCQQRTVGNGCLNAPCYN